MTRNESHVSYAWAWRFLGALLLAIAAFGAFASPAPLTYAAMAVALISGGFVGWQWAQRSLSHGAERQGRQRSASAGTLITAAVILGMFVLPRVVQGLGFGGASLAGVLATAVVFFAGAAFGVAQSPAVFEHLADRTGDRRDRGHQLCAGRINEAVLNEGAVNTAQAEVMRRWTLAQRLTFVFLAWAGAGG